MYVDYVAGVSLTTRGTHSVSLIVSCIIMAKHADEIVVHSLAGHEVSRIVSCVVAKHADETAYSNECEPRGVSYLTIDLSIVSPLREKDLQVSPRYGKEQNNHDTYHAHRPQTHHVERASVCVVYTRRTEARAECAASVPCIVYCLL